MSDDIIKVPDIGSGEAEVIEICVQPGQSVSAEDSLIVLESDKATMEVPAPFDGLVKDVLLKVGDRVAEGAPMVTMSSVADSEEPATGDGAQIETVRVPDIGAENVPVIEICIKVGDTIAAEDSLIVLESDKATMEVPSPVAGVVQAIHVKEGDTLSQGDQVVDVSVAAPAEMPPSKPAPAPAKTPAEPVATAPSSGVRMENITVPDIGTDNVPVIEICVSVGDRVEEESSLIVLESDKATMEVPSPFAGVIKGIKVREGDTLSQGDLILSMEVSGGVTVPVVPAAPQQQKASRAPSEPPPHAEANPVELERSNRNYHAGPAVRKLAREFGVDLAVVTGSGPRHRILKEDVQRYVKKRLSDKPAEATGAGIPVVCWVCF